MRVAQEEARMLLGTPDKWEKYFPRDLSQVFIGDPSAHADALKNIKKHGIYILDDAGVSINGSRSIFESGPVQMPGTS
jgi:hypothetical protein